jgi:hypothetical protein
LKGAFEQLPLLFERHAELLDLLLLQGELLLEKRDLVGRDRRLG